MNLKALASAISCIAILAASIPAIAQMSIQMDEDSIRIEGNGIYLESSSDGIFIESITQDENSEMTNNRSISVESDRNEINITQENTDMPKSHSSTDSFQLEQEVHETIISLNAADTTQPNILSISTLTATQLTGQIKVDNTVIQSISNDNSSINLSPYLTTGRHIIKILGKYTPINSSVTIKFAGHNKQIILQTGGNGNVNQTIIFDVI